MVGGKHQSGQDPHTQAMTREQVRKLIQENPHASNILRTLECYVTGPGLRFKHECVCKSNRMTDVEDDVLEAADHLWEAFLQNADGHYSPQEHARRTWRDGECFIRKFGKESWPPAVRFVDPERFGATPQEPDPQGIVTAAHDVETPLAYLYTSRSGQDGFDGMRADRIPAGEILQTRIGVDSNEKRGRSLFAAILEPLIAYSKWMETELLARKLQSSIVLWRKVQGSSQTADAFADNAGSGTTWNGQRRERFSPGSILTTNHATDIQFLQPNTNFGDAASLGRMLLLSIAAGAGLPEFMLTSDASNGNFASTMVAEGPAVKYFQSQQEFFSKEFTRMWRWIMQDAVDLGLLPVDFFERVTIKWTFPGLVNRDRPKERLTDARLVETGILSRAEVARRDGVDPVVMESERRRERGTESDSSDSEDLR
ncbi:Phage portal protein, lambda family [Thalassoglobus neptunius]|uniref:Phage portal protein, lambda family n=1 Tax=Thalassoglobus neptunius TaxID=1938619 RepID=A0A5C5WMX5_9PLAN|nr:phage portal protein [Thalassoglobus neptunius]TWT51535.1 Phage portal protein, lambda family [Thalassoglobus neptunius]